MSHAEFLVSLDFELFWGVSDSRSLDGYRAEVEGEWSAIPAMLELFARNDVRATWATVGMLMCRDFEHWQSVKPRLSPGYERESCSNYSFPERVRQNPRMFFAPELVRQIQQTPGQEIASHTYSHFFCFEPGASRDAFAADMDCAIAVAQDHGLALRSFVFPRNQVRTDFLDVLGSRGIRVFRGNPRHWLYRDGHFIPGGLLGRAVRLLDNYLPVAGQHVARAESLAGMVNVPASIFLRPWSSSLAPLDALRLRRIKQSMLHAARSGGVFHLWWHPHNFGVNQQQNLAFLAEILAYFQQLKNDFGMQSRCMADFSN